MTTVSPRLLWAIAAGSVLLAGGFTLAMADEIGRYAGNVLVRIWAGPAVCVLAATTASLIKGRDR